MEENKDNFISDSEEFLRFMKNTRVEGQIEFPVEVSAIKNTGSRHYKSHEVGSWVSIRPVGDDKTYLGVYLGDQILEAMHSYNLESKELSIYPHTNPAIYVPDLKKVVWGCESWWGTIDFPDDLKKISDIDIQNIWYVKVLKELAEKTV